MKVPMPSADTRLADLLAADPIALIDRLEDDAFDPSDPYLGGIEALMRSSLPMVGDVDDARDAALLRETSAGRTLEKAARYVGFALAFEYLRLQLGTAANHDD